MVQATPPTQSSTGGALSAVPRTRSCHSVDVLATHAAAVKVGVRARSYVYVMGEAVE